MRRFFTVLAMFMAFAAPVASARGVDSVLVRMKENVSYITAEQNKGRKGGSAEEKAVAEYLYSKNIVCEFSDEDYTVIMLTPMNTDDELSYLLKVLSDLPKKAEISAKPPHITAPERVISLGECIYMPTEKVSTESAVGRICGAINVSCPPAVPIVVAGERIGEREKELLAYYGVDEIEVISE